MSEELKDANKLIITNIEEVKESIDDNIMRLNYEAPYCNQPIQSQILYAKQKLKNASIELERVINSTKEEKNEKKSNKKIT